MTNKKPAHTFRKIGFPECASRCAMVEYLGVGECESVCPWKFDKEGRPIEIGVAKVKAKEKML